MFWFIYVSKFYKLKKKLMYFGLLPQIGAEQTVVLIGVW
jgi:hypothetical protein